MGLMVRLVGTVEVLHGTPPAVVEIGSPKERRLLAMLAAQRPHPLTPDRLAEVLWPERPPRRPTANVATLVSRLRSRLGTDAVLGGHQAYRLGDPPAVRTDVDQAAELVAEAARRLGAGAPGMAATAAERALTLLEGSEPLLGETDAPWVVAVRRTWTELRPASPRTPAPRATGSRIGSAAPALVGRAAEAAELAEGWELASAGHPGVLLIVGEAGIGKTRLASELMDTAGSTGARVATGRCHVAERSLFLQPVVDALGDTLAALPESALRDAARHRARVLAGLFPELAEALGVADGDGAAPDARRAFEAIGAPLRALTATRPMLLVLDDLHNAGLATVELLHHLALRTGHARLLVVATLRVEEGATALERLERGPTASTSGRCPHRPSPSSRGRRATRSSGARSDAGRERARRWIR